MTYGLLAQISASAQHLKKAGYVARHILIFWYVEHGTHESLARRCASPAHNTVGWPG